MRDQQERLDPGAERRGEAFDSRAVGGVLLVLAASVSPAFAVFAPVPGTTYAGVILFSAALVVLSSGRPGVVGDGGIGRVSLLVLAVWILGSRIAWDLLGASDGVGTGGPTSLIVWNLLDDLVKFSLAAIVAVAIARAGTLRPPWNYSAIWALGAVGVSWIAAQVAVAIRPVDLELGAALLGVHGLVLFAATMLLGFVAIFSASGTLGRR